MGGRGLGMLAMSRGRVGLNATIAYQRCAAAHATYNIGGPAYRPFSSSAGDSLAVTTPGTTPGTPPRPLFLLGAPRPSLPFLFRVRLLALLMHPAAQAAPSLGAPATPRW